MIKKINDKYTITHYKEINFILQELKNDTITVPNFNKSGLPALKEKISQIPELKDCYSAEELLDFYQTNFLQEIKNLANFCKFDLYTIIYYFPPPESLLIIPSAEAEKYLRKNRNIDLISLFRLENYANEIKKTICLTPPKCNFHLQRHGLIPISDFVNIKPPDESTIFYVNGQSYFTSINIFEVFNENRGVSKGLKRSNLVEIPANDINNSVVMGTNGRIFETLDGKNFRELKTRFKNLNNSPVCFGYNSQFNVKQDEPFVILEKNKFIEKYNNILLSIRIEDFDKIKDNLASKLLEALETFDFKFEMDKIMRQEFKTDLRVELIKIETFVKNSKNYNEFKMEIMNHQKNFILNVFNKMKIYEHSKKISRTSTQSII